MGDYLDLESDDEIILEDETGFLLLEDGSGWRVFVDWNNDNDFADANEDISDYLLSIPLFSQGRSSDTDYDDAGTCTVELKNNTAFFSPLNTASPIYGSILPNRRVKITMTYNGTTTTMWQGFLEDIQVHTGENLNASTATLQANGPLAQFNEADFDLATQQTIKTGAVITALLNGDSWPAGDRDIDDGLTTLPEVWANKGTSRLTTMREMQDMEFGRLRESKDGKVVFDDRDAVFTSPHNTAQATYGTGTLNIWNLQQLDPRAGIYNSVRATCRPYNYTDELALVTICDLDKGKGGTPPSAAGGSATTNLWVELPADFEFSAVSSWTSTSHKANTAIDGSGSDITANVSIVITPYGGGAKLAITNTSASTAYLIKLIVYGRAWTQGDPAEVRSDDATSQGKYGRREYRNIGEWHTSVSYTQQHADYAVTLYKNPRAQISFDVFANRDATHMAEVMAREIGDRIHVTAGADTGVYVDNDFIIDSLTHRVNSKFEHRMTIVCTKAPTAQLGATGEAYSPKIIPSSNDIYPSSDSDTGNPSGINTVAKLTDDEEGKMSFSVNRSSTNYKSIYNLQIVLHTGATPHGPYGAMRAAFPGDVLASGNVTVVAGQYIYAIASGTADLWKDKVLIIHGTGDANLEGNVINADSGSAITLGQAFKVSGSFAYNILEPWWTLNPWEEGFRVPEQLITDRESTIWRTQKRPIKEGTYYITAYERNDFGLSAAYTTSGSSVVHHTRTGATWRSAAAGARIEHDPTNGTRGIDGSGNVLSQSFVDGSTTIRTAASGARAEYTTANGFRGIDGSANALTEITTGGYFRAKSAVSNARIEISTSADGIQGFDASGQVTQVGLDGKFSARSQYSGVRWQIDSAAGIRGLDGSANVVSKIDPDSGLFNSKSAVSAARMEYDQTNGIRGYDASGNLVFQVTIAGVPTIMTAYAGARVTIDGTNGFRGINAAGLIKVQVKTDGYIYSDGVTTINTSNYLIQDGASTYQLSIIFDSGSGFTKIESAQTAGYSGSLYIGPASDNYNVIFYSGADTLGTFNKAYLNLPSGSVLKINAIQVVGAQQAHLDDPDIDSIFAWAASINKLLEAHGLMASS